MRYLSASSTKREYSADIPVRQRGITFSLCISGSADFYLNNKRYPVRKGDICIKIPGNLYGLKRHTEDFDCSEITVPEQIVHADLLAKKDISVDMALMIKYPVMRLDEEGMADYIGLANLCKRLHNSATGRRDKCTRNAYLSLIYFVCETLPEHFGKDRVDALYSQDRNYYYFVRFLDLLGKHCCEERRIKFYADKICITPKHLSGMIKAVSGKSANSWINEYVVQEAKSRLQFSEKSVQEIGFDLNFPNASFFGRYFKRITGMSPLEFRHQNPAA